MVSEAQTFLAEEPAHFKGVSRHVAARTTGGSYRCQPACAETVKSLAWMPF